MHPARLFRPTRRPRAHRSGARTAAVVLAAASLLGAVSAPSAGANPAPPTGMVGATLTGIFDGISRSATIAGTVTPTTFSGGATAVATPFVFDVACDPSSACVNTNRPTITWSFGDGTTCSTAAACAVTVTGTPVGSASADLTAVSHTYASPGSYTVTTTISSPTGYAKASIQALVSPRFSDVAAGSGRVDREAIWTVAALGLMSGCSGASFCPEPTGSPDPAGLTVPLANGITKASCISSPAATCGLPPAVFSLTDPTATCDGGAATGACHTALAIPFAATSCPPTAGQCAQYPAGQPLYNAPAAGAPAGTQGTLTYNPDNCADNYVATQSATGAWSAAPGLPAGCESRSGFFSLANAALDQNKAVTSTSSVSCPDASSGSAKAYARLNALGVGSASATIPVLTRSRAATMYCDPTASITKGEAYGLLEDAAHYPANTAVGGQMRDLAATGLTNGGGASPYEGAVGALLASGAPLVGSTRCVDNTGTCFNAQDALTRGQAAQLVANMLAGPDRVYGGVAINLSADNSPQNVGAAIHVRAQVSIPSYYPATTVTLHWTLSDPTAAAFSTTDCQNSIPVNPGQTVIAYCDVVPEKTGAVTVTTPATTTATTTTATTPVISGASIGTQTPSVTINGSEIPPSLGAAANTTGTGPVTVAVPVYDASGYAMTYTVRSATGVSLAYPTALHAGTFAQTAATPTTTFAATAPTEVGTAAVDGGASTQAMIYVVVTPQTAQTTPTARAAAFGPYDFTIQACDSTGNASGCASEVVTGTIYAANTAPVAAALSQTLPASALGGYGATQSFAASDTDWGEACYRSGLATSIDASNGTSDQGVPCPAGVYTTAAAGSLAGASSVSVANANQLVPGESMTIDPTTASADSVVVATVPATPGVGTITLAAPMDHAHSGTAVLVVTNGIGSYSVTALPTVGTLQVQDASGTWVAATTGTTLPYDAWRYGPPATAWGGTDSFTYTARDNGLATAPVAGTPQDTSATSPPATVTLNLPAAPTAPASLVCTPNSPSAGSTQVTWAAETDSRITGYNVYRALPGVSSAAIGSTSGIGSTTLTDSVTSTGVNLLPASTGYAPTLQATAVTADHRTSSLTGQATGSAHAVTIAGAGYAVVTGTTPQPVTAGGRYSSSVSIEGASDQNILPLINWYNASGTFLGSANANGAWLPATPSSYTQFQVSEVSAPAGATSAALEFIVANSGGATTDYFDAAQLIPDYSYWVTAHNASGQETAQAGPASCTPADPVPGIPTATYTTLPTGTSEAAAWTPQTYTQYYDVEQHADAGPATMTGTPTTTYRHLYATTVTSAVAAGASTITVASAVGLVAGLALVLVHSGTSQTFTISGVSGAVVTLSAASGSAYPAGTTAVLSSDWSVGSLGNLSMEDVAVRACNASGCSSWTTPSTRWTPTTDSLDCAVPAQNSATKSSGACTQSWTASGSNATAFPWTTYGALHNYANYANPSANTDTIANPTGGGGAGLCNHYSTSVCANGTLTAVYTGSTTSSSNSFTGIMGNQGSAAFCASSASVLGGGACANVQGCRAANVTGANNCSAVAWAGSADWPTPGSGDPVNYYTNLTANACYNPGGGAVPYPTNANLGFGITGDPSGTFQNQCDFHIQANWATTYQIVVNIPGNQGFWGQGGQVYCYNHYATWSGDAGCTSNGTAGDWGQAYFAGGWINIERFSRGDAVGSNRGVWSGYGFGGPNDAEDIIVPEFATGTWADNIFVAPGNGNQCVQTSASSPPYYDASHNNVCNFTQDIATDDGTNLGSVTDNGGAVPTSYGVIP